MREMDRILARVGGSLLGNRLNYYPPVIYFLLMFMVDSLDVPAFR